ncbi:MAG: membrane protein insertase YidC [Longimicrobiales bacterium]|nr:membrane protein insertase YidC [Longimicrobiales bacterium]
MRTELRLLMAVGLMILVMVGVNILFPPLEPEPGAAGDAAGQVEDAPGGGIPGGLPGVPGGEPAGQGAAAGAPAPGGGVGGAGPPAAAQAPREEVVVETPLSRYAFQNYGAALVSAELLRFPSLSQGNGVVQIVPDSTLALENRLVVGRDTLRLSTLPFTVEPDGGLVLGEGDGPRTLTFRYENGGGFRVEVAYTFHPDSYVVDAEVRTEGVQRALLFTTLGRGIAFNEADSTQESRAMAWVGNHRSDGIRANPLSKVDAPRLVEGPFRWVAFKSRYFVSVLLPSESEAVEEPLLGGVLVDPDRVPDRAGISVAHPTALTGVTRYRVFLGPQEYATLQSLATDLEEVNPYGWRFFRPVIRPFVGIILWVLNFLHNTLSIGYGWVLILFGVLMRVLLWPLNQKAMRAQIRNMAVQPLMKEIQTRYKDNPERMQKEVLRLHKEHGFNPLGGCLPMLLPWPILIALFFVFQNTIEFRGVPFLWLPDLSAKDPLFILPVFLAVSMFLLQWITLRSMPESNPQMRVMLWFMPIGLGILFLQFPSGLNLYYAVMNIATIPQQVLIARERQRVKPLKASGGEPGPAKGGGGGGGGSGPPRKGRRKR